MDALAVSYAGELARWNIETTIVVPGAFTSGTNHFAHAGSPEDKARLKEYESGPTANLTKQIMKGFELTAVSNADVSEVAKAIVKVVDMPFGTRPFRAHIDPANDGAEIVNGVADRVRAELLRNMKLADLLRSSSPATQNEFRKPLNLSVVKHRGKRLTSRTKRPWKAFSRILL
jgi:hypothetical protein